MRYLTLGDLIAILEQEEPGRVIPYGFSAPGSYRGYYEDLAFHPTENVSIGAMLKDAKDSMGKTFSGYKGGDFIMKEYTSVWLAEYGCEGETLGPILLNFMLGKTPWPAAEPEED